MFKEAVERDAYGGEGLEIGDVSVGEGVAKANGRLEKQNAVAAESDSLEVVELRAAAAHGRRRK